MQQERRRLHGSRGDGGDGGGSLIGKVEQVEEQLWAEREEREELRDAITQLKLELSARPQVRDWRAAQKRIAFLERKLESAEDTIQDLQDAH